MMMREFLVNENVAELVKEIKEDYSKGLNAEVSIDKKFIENNDLLQILENYTLLMQPTLTGKFLNQYQEVLKQDIIEFAEDNEIEYSLETLSKIAFFRLQKISKKYYLESVYESNKEKFEPLKKQAQICHKEYEIIAAIL